eukprot:3335527-Prymnesium_polylepis.1
MSGWDNLEGKNTVYAYRCARGRKHAKLRGPAPGHLGLDHVVNANSFNSPSLYPVTGRHRSS